MSHSSDHTAVPSHVPFVFFGTPRFAAIILDELEAHGMLPSLIVTALDKPKGRKLVLTPSEVKVWATERQIPILTPQRLRDEGVAQSLRGAGCPLFIVAAYGKIIPKEILDIPAHGTLNVHPSLLPFFRGPSPIESAILSKEPGTGVSIMLLDEETDHGPIVAQQPFVSDTWPVKGSVLTENLAHEGGALLASVIEPWMREASAQAQDHAKATFTKKITKEDGRIALTDDPLSNYKKYLAYDEWPGTYFFTERNGKEMRVRIAEATYQDGVFSVTRVVPEGKKEMSYADFLRGTHQ